MARLYGSGLVSSAQSQLTYTWNSAQRACDSPYVRLRFSGELKKSLEFNALRNRLRREQNKYILRLRQ
jgi:hypothetical protein